MATSSPKITGDNRPARSRGSSVSKRAPKNEEIEERQKEREEEERKKKEKERQHEFLAEKVFMQRQRTQGMTGQVHGANQLSNFVMPSLLDSYVKRNHFEGNNYILYFFYIIFILLIIYLFIIIFICLFNLKKRLYL